VHYALLSMPSRPPALSRRRFGGGLALAALGLGAAGLAAKRPSEEESMPSRETPSPAASLAGRVPVGFLAHGAPTLALDPERGSDFRRWGETLGKPNAILVVSAHWEGAPVSIGTTEARALMYDFSGFPDPLYQVRYPSPGAPALASRLEALLGPGVRREPTRALDHGVWVPLVHLFPNADVPVLQISMPTALGAKELFALGQKLAPLRDEGVLIFGSGNLTHNLRRLDWRGAGGTPAWASDFDSWIADVLVRHDFDALVDYAKQAPALRENHPTEEHLQPLLVVAGAASHGVAPVSFPVQGFEFGSLSRRSVQLG